MEYRGYDSVGYAVIGESLILRKAAGKLDDVAGKLNFEGVDGFVGMGHTRWATHGSPNDINAHPHSDCTGRIVVAHNGIVQNYLELKEWLIKKGHIFRSETDTEVIPHLIEELKSRGMTTLDALRRTVKTLRGTFAILVLDLDEPNKIFFARYVSPLIIGVGEGVNFIASDIPAFLKHTNRVLVLKDGELGYVSQKTVYVEHVERGVVDVSRRIRIIDWTPSMAMKGGYPHFMLKEIHEQPMALRTTINGFDESLDKAAEMIMEANNVFIAACGTSYHAALVGEYALAKLAGRLAHPFIASEYTKYLNAIDENDLLIAVSQSGETIDTLMAVRKFKGRGARVIAVSNVVDSAIPRDSDLPIYTKAGPEIGVAATKTFTTQVAVLLELSYRLGLKTGRLTKSEYLDLHRELTMVPKVVSSVIRRYEGHCKELGRRLKPITSMYYLSRGVGVPVAMEGALKLKEISYIHAEAYPAGESKHGPIALIERGFPTMFLAFRDEYMEAILGNVMEMKARGAYTIGLVPEDSSKLIEKLDYPLKMPYLTPYAASIVYVVPLQLIAYYASVERGLDPDKPRNLAKTVTVE